MDSVSNSLDVKVALELSVQIKFINISTSISTEYKDAAEKSSRNSESNIKARGGNVSLVTAFTTGQQATIDATTLRDWQKTVTPKDAALIDIRLQDYHGKEFSLSEVAAQNRIVLLSFTMYSEDFSPVYNKLLNDLYTKYKSQGLAVYQISLDSDPVTWRQAAQNLPWITVYEPSGPNAVEVGIYQVMSVPCTFIIRNGELVERIDNPTGLANAVARHL